MSWTGGFGTDSRAPRSDRLRSPYVKAPRRCPAIRRTRLGRDDLASRCAGCRHKRSAARSGQLRYRGVVSASNPAASSKPSVSIPAGAPPTALESEDLVVGEGDEATDGRFVDVHYVGVAWSSQQQFDASWDRNQPFRFALGAGQVISGWDRGVAGMRVGGRRRLTIPPDLGYGTRGAGGVIGPNETLVFVVDLLGVR